MLKKISAVLLLIGSLSADPLPLAIKQQDFSLSVVENDSGLEINLGEKINNLKISANKKTATIVLEFDEVPRPEIKNLAIEASLLKIIKFRSKSGRSKLAFGFNKKLPEYSSEITTGAVKINVTTSINKTSPSETPTPSIIEKNKKYITGFQFNKSLADELIISINGSSDHGVIKLNDTTFEIKLAETVTPDSKLSLPFFAPDNFKGFTFVKLNQEKDLSKIIIGVDPGFRVSTINKPGQIIVRCKKD